MRALLSFVLLACALTAEAAPPIKHEVLADGHSLALWEKRPAAPRATVLLVHGRTWSALPNFDLQVPGMQRSVLDGFVAAGYAAYAIDLRGYGASARDETGWLTPDRAVEDVRITLEWIRTANPRLTRAPALVGYSRGSFIALLAAKRHPASVSSLVLYGFPGVPPPPSPEVAAPPRIANTAKAAASDFITPGAASQAVIDAYVQQALKSDPIRVDWRDEGRLVSTDRVDVPTMLIYGAGDPFLASWRHNNPFDPELQKLTDVVLPGSDHAAHIENSQDAWLQSILEFIDRPRGQSP